MPEPLHDAYRAREADQDDLWSDVDRLLEGASLDGIVFHKLGALEARRLRSRGDPLPTALQWEEKAAAVLALAVGPLLAQVRAGCDGPLVLMKGPELALGYPGRARTFHDLDLLVPDARLVHGQLKEAGLVEIGDAELYFGIHHLRPLRWQSLPLVVEVHSRPKWPNGLGEPPPTAEIIASAVPTGLGVGGIQSPDPAQHALLVAAHAWAHEPLRHLRDLLDVQVAAASADRTEIERVARAWGLWRLWHTTDEAAAAALGLRRPPLAVRLWARHLGAVRERTVAENHLQRLLAGFWALPLRSALTSTAAAVAGDLRPAFDEGWREKVARVIRASTSATTPLSNHNRRLGDSARRGQTRNPPGEDDISAPAGDRPV